MKTFKTRLVESNFEEMPHGILHAKTASILQDHGYAALGDRPGEKDRYSHSAETYDDDVNSYHEFNRAKEKLEGLGWKRLPLASTHHVFDGGERSDDTMEIAHDHFQHPNGSHLVHTHIGHDYLDDAGDKGVRYTNEWHIKNP